MTTEELNRGLTYDRIVRLSASDWAAVEDTFDVIERHPTMIAGDLIIARGPLGLVAVEQPAPEERVVRLLTDIDEAHRFVKDRLKQYERMWDGCGCKIEYYA